MSFQTTTTEQGGVPTWDLADRLQKARRTAGIGVQQMADDLGYTRKTIGDYLNGRTAPRRSVIVAWAIRCGVSPAWLEHGVDIDLRDGPDDGPGQGIHPFGWIRGRRGQAADIVQLYPLAS